MAAATASPRPTSAALQMPLQIVALQGMIAVGCAVAFAAAAAAGLGLMAQAGAALLAGACVCLPGAVVARALAAPNDAGATADASRQAADLDAPVQPIAWIVGGLMATVVLMALAFALFKPPAIGFFTALVATQLAPVIAPAWQDRQRRRARSASR